VDTIAGGTPTLTVGDNNASTTFYGAIQNSAGVLRLTKIGAGVLTLNGANTSSGLIVVSNGTLLVNGSLGTNSVTVCANATLGGSGTVGGAVAIQANGQLAPGAGADSAGTVLTLSDQLTLASGSLTTMKVQTGNVGDRIATGGALVYGGALIVTNTGGALSSNDHFTLFSATDYSGNLSSLALPALGAGLGWSNSLSRDGSLTVVAGTVGPAAVTNLLPDADRHDVLWSGQWRNQSRRMEPERPAGIGRRQFQLHGHRSDLRRDLLFHGGGNE
jgi:fibronectin-binding autotransporter adhesin